MSSNVDSILGLIGLATKARKTVTGAEGCEAAIKSGKSMLVILAKDASEKTKMPVIRLCEHRQSQLREFASKDELGKFTGKPNRAIVVITDSGFAKRITQLIDIMENEQVDNLAVDIAISG